MAATERIKLRDIKLQYYTFNTPLISIYISSMASIQISVRLVVLTAIQIGIRFKVAAIQIDGKLKRL